MCLSQFILTCVLNSIEVERWTDPFEGQISFEILHAFFTHNHISVYVSVCHYIFLEKGHTEIGLLLQKFSLLPDLK